jgi:hypothetical protein
MMHCKICGQSTLPRARAKIIDTYDIQYFQCPSCGFVQTEEPYWLDRAYASAISEIDIGVVNRSVTFSRLTRNLILACFDSNATFLDYGGGPGLFVRMMRDAGFDFYIYDKYCENMFARGFEADPDNTTHYELVTAFEVFEHFAAPIDEIERVLQRSRSVLFSTLLLPPSNPVPGDWWYYAPEHGQHVAIYTRPALAMIARKFGLRFYTNGSSLHLFTDKTIHPLVFSMIFRRKLSALASLFLSRRQKKKSLLEEDFFKVSGLRLR